MDPKELIAALGVYSDPNSSDEDKAAALEKLTAFFNSLLEQQAADAGGTQVGEQQAAVADPATETNSAADPDPAAQASSAATPYESSKEMSSALAAAHEQIKTLTDRVSKMEKASAIGSAPRVAKPTVLPRKEPPAPKDPFISMIEAAGQNTLRNMSK